MIDIETIINNSRNDINDNICTDLIDLIKAHNLLTEKALQEYEAKYFNTPDLLERIKIKYKEYQSDTTHFDYLDSLDILTLKEYSKSLEEEQDPLLKCKYLILIYDLLEWQLYFPYEAYLLNINRKL